MPATASAEIEYSVTIDQNYANGAPLLARDILTNELNSMYDVADDPTAEPAIVGATNCMEDSESSFTITDIQIFKETITPSPVQPGDFVTYRLRMVVPSGDTNDLAFEDFLPLPVFDATTVSTDTNLLTNPNISLGPTDTLGLTPTSISIDAGNNSVRIEFPNITTTMQQVVEIDLLVQISNEPFADNLTLSNLFQAETNSTPIDTDTELTIDDILVLSLIHI